MSSVAQTPAPHGLPTAPDRGTPPSSPSISGGPTNRPPFAARLGRALSDYRFARLASCLSYRSSPGGHPESSDEHDLSIELVVRETAATAS
jgi:hypothetical protein